MEISITRRLQIVAALLLLAVSMALHLPGAPKADAALHNLFPADVNGFPKGQFRADEAMFIDLDSDFNGGAVCVVDASVTDPATANCKNPPWGDKNTYVAIGSLVGVPFSGPLLRPGTWKLLATDTSGNTGTELSDPFTVVSCSPTCDPTAAQSQLQPWKDRAATQIPPARAQELALAVDIATRTYKIMSAAYSGLSFGLGAAIIAGGWAAANFDFVVPSTEDLAKALYKQLRTTVSAMWASIALDPPDPNFGTVAQPVFTTVDPTGDSQVDAYFDANMRAAAYGDASRIANERYEGAVAAGDHAAAAMQAEASANFTYELIGQLRIINSLESTVAGRSWATEPIVEPPAGQDPATWWTNEIDGIAALTPTDLSASDRQFLKDHNPTITDAQIDAAVANWSDPNWIADMRSVDPTATIGDAMDASAALLGDTRTTLDAFGRWMSLNAADEQALVPVNHPPVAAPLTVSAFQDEAAAVTLSGSDPDGDAITAAVATGPGHGTLSGTAPNLTYTPDAGYSGTDSFTYTVSDGSLTSAPATVAITVGQNHPPSAGSQTYQAVPGLPTAVHLSGSDPDGRPVTLSITAPPTHGTVTGTPPNLVYTPDDTFDTGDSLTFSVSDGVYSTPGTITFAPASVTARDDTVAVSGAQIVDVTGNDTPTGARVTDVSDPAHGTVTCSDFGVCFYVADDGYTGADHFDYTLRVGANSDTATVTLNVGPPPATATGVPVAVDDTLSTAAGTAGTVDVLANDTGPGPLTVVAADGVHGSVDCLPTGPCTYTPIDATFVGFDQFSYTVSNGTDVDTGLVRVRVGTTPSGLRLDGGPTGGGTSVDPGGSLGWDVGLTGLGPVGTGPSRSDPIAVQVSGPQTLSSADVATAAGWTTSFAGDTVTATPGAGAVIGNEATTMLPRPLPPISQGIGGDGHVPILVGSKVFAFFHHQRPTQITCVDRSTGQLCPGYPKAVPLATRNTPGPGAVIGSQLWVHLYSSDYRIAGLFCWDASTNATCGFVANRPGTESWEGTAPVLVDGKLWFATAAGRLRCVDPDTKAACAAGPFDTGITFGLDRGDIVNRGSRVYVSNFSQVACVDVATGEACTGWEDQPRSLAGNLVRSHDAHRCGERCLCGGRLPDAVRHR